MITASQICGRRVGFGRRAARIRGNASERGDIGHSDVAR
jgi:hypothetical protein